MKLTLSNNMAQALLHENEAGTRHPIMHCSIFYNLNIFGGFPDGSEVALLANQSMQGNLAHEYFIKYHRNRIFH